MSQDNIVQTRRPALARGIMLATSFLIAVLIGVSAYSEDLYFDIADEDGFVEWLTVAGLLVAGVLYVVRWRGFRQNQSSSWSLMMLLTTLLFVFGIGEELSWGQRLLGFGAELDLSANRQNEFNLHNLQLGDFNLNKVVFSLGFGLALGVYFLVLPWAVGRWAWLRDGLTRVGIPVSSWTISLWFVFNTLAVQLISDTKKWETLEVLIPASALVILWSRGVVGKELYDCCGQQDFATGMPSPLPLPHE